MLTEQQCNYIEQALTEKIEPRKVAAYLCLHMGLMLGEVTGLQWGDIDLDKSSVALCRYVGSGVEKNKKRSVELLPFEPVREIHMPPHVKRYLERLGDMYPGQECFVMNAGTEIPDFYPMQNLLTSISNRYDMGLNLSTLDLRNAFIRRAILEDTDLYSLCKYIGIRQPNTILNKFGEYFTAKSFTFDRLEKYSFDYEEKSAPSFSGPKRMNLLILGIGSQGQVVKEIAEAIGIFDDIQFLDDDKNNKYAIGPLSYCERLKDNFTMAIPSFGDSQLREHYMDVVESLGYVVPSLRHPSATISPSAVIERSVVIEARSIVSSGTVVGRGTIISSAAVVEAGANIGCFCHVGSSVTVARNAVVPDFERIPAGNIVRPEKV